MNTKRLGTLLRARRIRIWRDDCYSMFPEATGNWLFGKCDPLTGDLLVHPFCGTLTPETISALTILGIGYPHYNDRSTEFITRGIIWPDAETLFVHTEHGFSLTPCYN